MPRLFFRALPWVILAVAVLILGGALLWIRSRSARHSAFTSSMMAGRNAFENADARKAVAAFAAAVRAAPTQSDAHLNLANAYLFAGDSEKAILEATEVLRFDKNSAAALYVVGCAQLRLGNPADALKALEQSRFIDSSVAATSFHIGRAHQALGQWDAAVTAFQQTITLEPQHTAAHYALSQAAFRVNNKALAEEEIKKHRAIAAQRRNVPNDITFYEKCVHTVARLPPVEPERPAKRGINVRFVDETPSVFGDSAARYRGPIGVIDAGPRGVNSIIVIENGNGVRMLSNQGGARFSVAEERSEISGEPRRCLVGDLNNDNLPDAVILSSTSAFVFRLTREGKLTDVTAASGFPTLIATDAALADLDFTGKLGLIAATSQGVSIWRNQGNAAFVNVTERAALPPTHAETLWIDDWNGDDLPDLFVAENGRSPRLFLNQHGGPLKEATGTIEPVQPLIAQVPATNATNAATNPDGAPWPSGDRCIAGDLDCDGVPDLVVAGNDGVDVFFQAPKQTLHLDGIPAANCQLKLLDYDNDGWLDLVAAGHGLRVWRNLGPAGFRETSAELGVGPFASSEIEGFAGADFDDDGDTDWLITVAGQGLRYLRNDGGNANLQLKVRLIGKRSNASNLGACLELIAGGWRTRRSVTSLPIEIGTGRHAKLDSFAVHTTDLVMNLGSLTSIRKSRSR